MQHNDNPYNNTAYYDGAREKLATAKMALGLDGITLSNFAAADLSELLAAPALAGDLPPLFEVLAFLGRNKCHIVVAESEAFLSGGILRDGLNSQRYANSTLPTKAKVRHFLQVGHREGWISILPTRHPQNHWDTQIEDLRNLIIEISRYRSGLHPDYQRASHSIRDKAYRLAGNDEGRSSREPQMFGNLGHLAAPAFCVAIPGERLDKMRTTPIASMGTNSFVVALARSGLLPLLGISDSDGQQVVQRVVAGYAEHRAWSERTYNAGLVLDSAPIKQLCEALGPLVRAEQAMREQRQTAKAATAPTASRPSSRGLRAQAYGAMMGKRSPAGAGD